MDLPQYRYRRLPADSCSIRILLLPRGSGNILLGKLVDTKVRGGQSYEALSYVWGDPEKTHMLRLDGGKRLNITASLYHALNNLRPRSGGPGPGIRAVWADGVCINQEDEVERAQQVQIMASIYRSARQVVTYVGEPHGDIDRAVGLARTLIQLARQRRRDGLPVNPVMNTFDPEGFGLPSFSDKRWDTLREFTDGRWSTRMWIVQESLLNDNMRLLWGDRELDWDLVADLSSDVILPLCYPVHSGLMDNRTDSSSAGISRVVTMQSLFRQLRKTGRGMPMLTLLEGCRDLQCTDNKDRVFALASLASDFRPAVDYKKNIRQVYIDTAIGLLSSGTAVLSYAGLRRMIPQLPTWVPDWTVPSAQIPILQCRDFQASRPRTGLSSKPMCLDRHRGILRVRGVTYDRIQHVTEKLQLWLYLARMERAERAKAEAIRLLKLGYYPGNEVESYLEALWRTLINDTDHVKRDAHISYKDKAPCHLAQHFEAWVRPDGSISRSEAQAYLKKYSFTGRQEIAPTDEKVYTSHQISAALPLWFHKQQNNIPPNASVFKPLRGPPSIRDNHDVPGWQFRDAILRSGNLFRKLCTTERGYLGMVPDEAREGDILVFFAGAKVPHVLRPAEVALKVKGRRWPGWSFSLVGDCYLHGLMRGEAFPAGVRISWEELILV
ncbi:heterokaryon incompatibility protein-domain-containing protein [Podospora aff. communis PSN243]|uniref:Heterokaryon incompatibility protein-domain-containing protein n=1 Tax=Podospora aff. communis PSN243 TaxID=3040156 RepID=A0AAV9G4Q5_9PEZI|nr:heterokaryon incompatibility protein-domain-containing protein [Podospora aff. communis PSN243]